jgi:hypothetical protein
MNNFAQFVSEVNIGLEESDENIYILSVSCLSSSIPLYLEFKSKEISEKSEKDSLSNIVDRLLTEIIKICISKYSLSDYSEFQYWMAIESAVRPWRKIAFALVNDQVISKIIIGIKPFNSFEYFQEFFQISPSYYPNND